MRRLVEEMICKDSGGHANISGEYKAMPKGLGISNRDFRRSGSGSRQELGQIKVPAREQNKLVGLLAPMRKVMVER